MKKLIYMKFAFLPQNKLRSKCETWGSRERRGGLWLVPLGAISAGFPARVQCQQPRPLARPTHAPLRRFSCADFKFPDSPKNCHLAQFRF